MSGDDNLINEAKVALFEVLDALGPHRHSLILVGAQAIYQHTGNFDLAVAEFTRDSDLVIDVNNLEDSPEISALLKRSGFYQSDGGNPGQWLSRSGIPIDLMAPDSLVKGGERSADLAPHHKMTARRTVGLEAAIVDHIMMEIVSPDDPTKFIVMKVAGPAALLVAKAHKIYERKDSVKRTQDKDALDIYRLLIAFETEELLPGFTLILNNSISSKTTSVALKYIEELFTLGSQPIGSLMVRRAVSTLGEADQIAQSVTILVNELLQAIGRS
jgi:hypothetical protein